MCVGLSAKVVRISEGTAVVDAGGAKREVSSELLEDLEHELAVDAETVIDAGGWLDRDAFNIEVPAHHSRNLQV